MTYYGKTIAELRKRKGMTQAELGNALSVTYQAVSKWENDQSQPGIDMVSEMCNIFNVSMDDFMKMAQGVEVKSEEEAATAVVVEPALSEEKTAEIIREELARAKQQEKEEEERARQAQIQAQKEHEEAVKEQERKTSAGWFRFGAIATSILATVAGVLLGIYLEWWIGLVSGLVLLTFGLHLGHDCLVFDMFIGAWTKSIHMPGIIFSLDLDGILFLIGYKFIVAPILSAVLTIAIGLGGTLLAIIISPFSFLIKAPSLIKEICVGEEI